MAEEQLIASAQELWRQRMVAQNPNFLAGSSEFSREEMQQTMDAIRDRYGDGAQFADFKLLSSEIQPVFLLKIPHSQNVTFSVSIPLDSAGGGFQNRGLSIPPG